MHLDLVVYRRALLEAAGWRMPRRSPGIGNPEHLRYGAENTLVVRVHNSAQAGAIAAWALPVRAQAVTPAR